MTQVQGLAKLNRRWGAIPDRVRSEVRIAMEKVANEVVRDMKATAPREFGDLVQSIGWTWGDAPAGSLTIGSVGGRDYGSMRITFYAGGGDAFYAKFQEFGTRKMAANPFFFPVWRIWKRRARSRMSRAMSKAIKSA